MRFRAGASPAFLVTLVASIAAGAALYRLGTRSLWFDEGYSIAITKLSWPDLWSQITGAGETNSAGFYVLLKAWAIFGQSEAAYRSLSVVAAVLSVFVIFALGRKLWSTQVGLFASAFAASSALVIRQAQEARSYAWVMLLVTLACLLLVHALDTNKRLYWLTFAVTSALAVYFHVLAAFMPVAYFVAWRCHPLRPSSRHAVEACVLWVLLMVPFAAGSIRAGQESWIPTPGLSEIVGFFQAMAGLASERSTSMAVPLVLVLIAIGVVTAFGSRKSAARPYWAVTMTLAWLVLPPATAFVASHVLQPVFYPRYLILCLPAAALLAAYGVSRIPGPIRLVPPALLVVMGLYNVAMDYERPSEDWRGAAAFVAANAQPGDYVAFTEEMSRHPFAFYAPEQLDLAPDPFGLQLKGPNPEIEYVALTPPERDRVWFVQSHAKYAESERLLLSNNRSLMGTTHFTGIEVSLYDR